ncbi:MAG TPA: TonB-dependent receptor [Thermoanaerobaculia bacterium]|nr:TonB-dependent receptor [Thermoanaerobaculia bacterium]
MLLTLAAVLSAARLATAQSPNTAAMTVAVSDPSDAAVPGATVTVTNTATGAVRQATTGPDGTVTMTALPLNGAYRVAVVLSGFTARDVTGLFLRAGEKATIKVRLEVAGSRSDVTVYGTTQGVRADAQIGTRLVATRIDETPILGRKVTTLPLLASAFRPAKGTGDLFVNATFFVTGVGSRRATTFTLDGASDDEGWGRQAAVATVPLGAVQEVTALSNAFSPEYGWTSGPALNMVTKSGTNDVHAEALLLARPGGMQARSFSTKGFCPGSTPGCVTPATLQSISPADVPDSLLQASTAVGGPIARDKTFFFLAADYTSQDRTTLLSSTLPSFVLPPDGDLEYTGHYRQLLVDGRLDQNLTQGQTLMLRFNLDGFTDDNPADAVGGTNAPTVAREYSRRALTAQANHTAVLSPVLVNEARVGWLDGDPVTLWEAQNLSTTYTRAGTVPFTSGQSRLSDLFSRQAQFSDTLSWSSGVHSFRVGVSAARHNSGGTGSEPGTATLGTFTFKSTTTAPLDQLTLADVQNYTQPINFGISSYDLTQWLLAAFVEDSIRPRPDLTIDLGLRYDRQTLTDAKTNFAPRVGFGWHPGGDERTAVRGGYGMYYTQIQSNLAASYLVNGLDGLTTYTAVAGQTGFPTCLTGPCLPVPVDPNTLPPSQLPARDIVIQAGQRDFYRAQFARYGLNFDLLPYYPDKLVNPRSQVITIGAERELAKGLFLGADYVHQHLSDIARTVDLNAPAPFDRTAPGQVRSVAAANATRPILPVNGGVREVNVLMNLGVADYDGLQTQLRYHGEKLDATISYTLSRATNTTEPDGNGVAPSDGNIATLGEAERGPSVLDQRHRAVISLAYRLPYEVTVGTLINLASARPFNATTGVDNNGDGLNNDRPVVDGQVVSKSAFRGTSTADVAAFIEGRIRLGASIVVLRVEGFNLFNQGNYLGRAQTIYGNAAAPASTFGQLVAVGTSSTALPALANVDPPRMFQLSARFAF